uniref:F-box associated domain-containing protein n=1 Tax=Aegilops tauschii TaxID=37682 RepID=M8C840_AEGTA
MLHRLATICKKWCRLVTDRCFLGRPWPGYSPSSFVAFFTEGNRHEELDAGCLPGPEPCFIPARRSALGPCRHSLGSFVTPSHAGLFSAVLPLISRHDLVVVRLEAHDTTGYPDKTIFQLGVCNLHAATCVMLRPLKVSPIFYDYDCNAYAILTSVDCCSKDALTPTVPPSNPSSFFQVVIIGYTGDDFKYNLHMFSSDKSSGHKRTNCFDSDAQSYDYGSFSDAIVHSGLAHWIFHNYGEGCLQVINLDAKTGNISFTKLPLKLNYQPTSHPCLTLGINGVLSLLWMQKEGPQLQIWEQHEDKETSGVLQNGYVIEQSS